MSIRWKVVTNDRKSITKYCLPEMACRTYIKGQIVESVPNSLGIFVFKRKYQAEKIMNKMRNVILLKVEAIGKGKQITNIVSVIHGLNELTITNPKEYATIKNQWEGTMGYDKIKVLT